MNHKPGIYLDMSADEYHADDALGSSSLKDIAIDPIEWQYKRLHGEEKDSEALTWGSALHARTLEGIAAYRKQFVVAPNKADYPDALDKMDELRAYAKSIGLKGGKTKDEVIAAIRQADASVPIWQEIVSGFEAGTAGKTIISAKMDSEVEQAARWMQADDKLSAVMKDGVFSAGRSEVSIFYEDNGVRLKCRFDHVLPHAIVDLKSFRTPVGWSAGSGLNRVLGRVIGQLRYDLQAADYLRGWKNARALFEAGNIHGASDADKALLKTAFANKATSWIWVLVKRTGAPQPFVREFALESFAYTAAVGEIEAAINTYRAMRDEFGDDADWSPRHSADVLGDEDFPSYMAM